MNIEKILDALLADTNASKTTIIGGRFSITIDVAPASTWANQPPPPMPPTPTMMTIPKGVFYNKESDNFYTASGNKAGMGESFYYTWKERWREFPGSATECT